MAHFSNSAEGEIFHNECDTCPYGEMDCPIRLVQLAYNYDQKESRMAKDIMNYLVKKDETSPFTYRGCQMKKVIDEADTTGD